MKIKTRFICSMFTALAVSIAILLAIGLLTALVVNYGMVIIDKVLHFLSHFKEYLDTYLNN